MSVGIEHEFGFRLSRFLKNNERYTIDTEALIKINPDFTLVTNQTFGKIEWNPKSMELVPLAQIFESLDFPRDYKWMNEKMKKFKMANLAIENYINLNHKFFEGTKKIPAEWHKFGEILFLGTIAQERGNDSNPLLVNALSGEQVSLSDTKIIKEARAMVYKL